MLSNNLQVTTTNFFYDLPQECLIFRIFLYTMPRVLPILHIIPLSLFAKLIQLMVYLFGRSPFSYHLLFEMLNLVNQGR